MRRSDSMFLSSIATTLPTETAELDAARPSVSSGRGRVRRMPQIKKRLKLMAKRLMRELGNQRNEAAFLLQGKEMAWRAASLPINTKFNLAGFKVFSQRDEDGIIRYSINKLPIEHETFIEFGVENYEESNTRFLMINNHWQNGSGWLRRRHRVDPQGSHVLAVRSASESGVDYERQHRRHPCERDFRETLDCFPSISTETITGYGKRFSDQAENRDRGVQQRFQTCPGCCSL